MGKVREKQSYEEECFTHSFLGWTIFLISFGILTTQLIVYFDVRSKMSALAHCDYENTARTRGRGRKAEVKGNRFISKMLQTDLLQSFHFCK